MKHMGHVTKFLFIFRNNLRPYEKRFRFEILENSIKDTKIDTFLLSEIFIIKKQKFFFQISKFFINTNAL